MHRAPWHRRSVRGGGERENAQHIRCADSEIRPKKKGGNNNNNTKKRRRNLIYNDTDDRYGYGYGYIHGPSPVPPIYLTGSFGPVLPAWTHATRVCHEVWQTRRAQSGHATPTCRAPHSTGQPRPAGGCRKRRSPTRPFNTHHTNTVTFFP